MGVFFVYILKASVCLTVFYLFYRLLLSRETFHRFNRIALLGILMLSCLLPLVEVTIDGQTEMHQTMMTLEQWLLLADMMNLAADAAVQPEGATTIWIQFALLIYLAGILFFAFRNGYYLLKLGSLLRKGRKEDIKTYIHTKEKATLIVHDLDISPFSWMKYVVISQKDLEENGREILTHELAHIHDRHSWDLLIADISIFFQWFNPASWLLKQELQNIHEYEADETVINEGIDSKQYQLLLIKKAVGTRLYSMANSFNHSKLKKRITMMLKEKSSPWAKMKYLYVLPVAAIAVTAFARPEISKTVEEISVTKISALSAIVETNVAKSAVRAVPADTVAPAESKRDGKVKIHDQNGNSSTVYDAVEVMPEFIGGISALMKYLQTNIRYPESAQKADISGLVVAQFIIDEKGDVTEPEVIRSLSEDTDAEAIRVIEAMPKWKPGMEKGKAVSVKYTIPISFNLEGVDSSLKGTIMRIDGKNGSIDEANPLIIIDGKEATSLTMQALSQDNITDVTILKDKSAIELYGEKGKNGVILIKLKKDSQLNDSTDVKVYKIEVPQDK